MLRARLVLVQGEGDAREVLLAYHHHPNRAFWCFPGGTVESGESLTATAIREAVEETGLRVNLGAICYLQDRPESDAVDVFFTASVTDGHAALGIDPDRPDRDAPVLTDLRWVRLRDLPSFAVLPAGLAAALTDGRFFSWGALPLSE